MLCMWSVLILSFLDMRSQFKKNVHTLQYAAVDKTGQCVAVAGKTGLAHYTFSTRKWKLFGNETQVIDVWSSWVIRQNTLLLLSAD